MGTESNLKAFQLKGKPEIKNHLEPQVISSKKWGRVLGVVVVLGVLAGGGLFWGGYQFGQRQKSQVVFTPTPSLSPLFTAKPLASPAVSPLLPKSSPSATVPSIPLERIDILPTDGWKTVSQNGVSFEIPPNAHCQSSTLSGEEDVNDCKWIYFGSEENRIPSQISVSEYQGGSRREQFLEKASYADCHWIFEEVYFGNVKALQIAADGGWCQGVAGGIVAVVGNKLVVFYGLYYDLDTKIIHRSPQRDTFVSTLKRK